MPSRQEAGAQWGRHELSLRRWGSEAVVEGGEEGEG